MDEDKTINNKILGLLTFIVLLFVSFICFIFIGIAKVDAQSLTFTRPRIIEISNYWQPNQGTYIHRCTDTLTCGSLTGTSGGGYIHTLYRIDQNNEDSEITTLPKGTYKLQFGLTARTLTKLNSSSVALSDFNLRIFVSGGSQYSTAYCDVTAQFSAENYSDNSNRIELTYTCPEIKNDRDDITFFGVTLYANELFSYAFISSNLKIIDTSDPNQSVIDNQNQNTQDIINNQNQNTQDIMNNQDKNTQDITNKLDEVDDTNKGILDTIRNFFGSFFSNLINGITGIFLPNNFDFLDGFLDTLENKLGFIASVPIQILEFLIDLVTYQFDNMTSITLPEFSVLNYDLWESQEIDLTEIINTFKPYRIYTNIACVSLCAYYLMKLYENFASGGGN